MVILVGSTTHIVQDNNYIIIIMYKQSNTITCFKCWAKFIFKNKIVIIYLKKT
jgi:hypothetical protein